MKYLFLSLVFLFAVSCQVESEQKKQSAFFDLNDFFQNEKDRFLSVKQIKKKVKVNDMEEEKIITDFDIKKDLIVFINSNINKITLLDKYVVDSTFNNNNLLSEINYQAKDKKLKTQELTIKFENQNVTSIFIRNVSTNLVASSDQELLFEPNIGYSMKSTQAISLASKQTRSVEVKFMK